VRKLPEVKVLGSGRRVPIAKDLKEDSNVYEELEDDAENESEGNVSENKVKESENVTHHPKGHHRLAVRINRRNSLHATAFII
jgi:hypothetical protein